MDNFRLLIGEGGEERIIRSRYPAFIATIKDIYSQDCVNQSKTFDFNGAKLKLCIDEAFEEAPDSKVNWALGKAVSFYKNEKKASSNESRLR